VINAFNSGKIHIFKSETLQAMPRKLTDFERTPLGSCYLRLDGQAHFQLVNEPFDCARYRI